MFFLVIFSFLVPLVHFNRSTAQPISKSTLVYGLWCRFEALTVMVQRGDQLFGTIVIIGQGVLFSNICISIYFILQQSIKTSHLELGAFYEMLFYLFIYISRLIFTISFMSKINKVSSELLSTVSSFLNQRQRHSDDEEKQIIRAFLDKLKETEWSACPSSFYKIKYSVFLTLLNLTVNYTIILLQTNNGSQNYDGLQRPFNTSRSI